MAVSTVRRYSKRWNTIHYIGTKNGEWLCIDSIFELQEWVDENIFNKIGINSEKTEDVLIRIATGMINNLPVNDKNKTEIHENLIHYRQIMRQEWTLKALTASKECPF